MNVRPFAPRFLEALLSIRRGAPDLRCVLIGANALACQLDMEWRNTNDLDLAVVADAADVFAELQGLGWQRHASYEHRWLTPQDVVVDVLPASLSSIASEQLVFPESGHVMSLVGFDLVLKNCHAVMLDSETSLDVAIVPVIAVLKMSAWLDRPADRERDLEDLAGVLTQYLEPDAMRRWEEPLLALGLAYEVQSAFALGLDIRRVAGPRHMEVIERFLAAISDADKPPFMRLARCVGPRDEEETLVALLGAFSEGLEWEDVSRAP